jgi:4-amino-4-deoxyprephenate dehydrogenase
MSRARQCLVAGGGAVGAMFASHLADSGYEVCVIDPRAPSVPGQARTRSERGDITDIGPALAAQIGRADLIVLAVPERVALAALVRLVRVMNPGALLVDTLSVKARIVAAIRLSAPGRQAVSLNPMFAPALGMMGRPVAAVVVRDGPLTRELLHLVGTWGGRVVPVTAADHDRLTSAAQALTHAAVLAFGLALAELDVEVRELTAIAPPPLLTLLALLARIVDGTPEVYWDVQSANPRAAGARAALADGARQLAALVGNDDEAGFAAVLAGLQNFLRPESERYRHICAQTFDAMTFDAMNSPAQPPRSDPGSRPVLR